MPRESAQPSTPFHTIYDSEGQRVKKETDLETTVFVYSSGKLVAEYSTKLSENPTTSYTTTDHLGTPRIITDELGQVKVRRDFMPFGEELFNGVGARSEQLKYGANADDLRQKFTGYQKDEETKLDFAEARMYENRYARFTAVDLLLASGQSANPQTFNRYVYVGNSPLVITDPTGLFGDYYNRSGKYLGSDPEGSAGYGDGEKYFADLAPTKKEGVWVSENSIEETTMFEVYAARRQAQQWYSQHAPGDVRENFWRLGWGVTNGVNDAIVGIAKGVGNSPVVALNGVTGSLANHGGGYLYFQGSNPFAVPLPFSAGNAREESYMSAGTTGTLAGVGFAARAVAAESSLSVVPKSSAGRFNPFIGKSPSEIDGMFNAKGFEPRGPNPVSGEGGYVNPRSGRSFHLDENNRFGEPPHVDVNRPRIYRGPLDKRKFPM